MTSSFHSLLTICQNWLWLGNLHCCSVLSCTITPIRKIEKKKKKKEKSPPIIKLPNKHMRTIWSGTLQNWNPSNKRRSQQECCEGQAEVMRSPAWAGRAPAAMPMGTGSCSRGWPWALIDSKRNWGQSVLKEEVHHGIPSWWRLSSSEVGAQRACTVFTLRCFSRPISIKP